MQNKFTFTVPTGDSIVEDTEKLVGRMSRSEMVREGLRLLNQKLKTDGSRSCPLPGWQHFEKFLHEASLTVIEDSLSKAKQLVNIAQREKDWRGTRIKI